jgi:hypothetical protein
LTLDVASLEFLYFVCRVTKQTSDFSFREPSQAHLLNAVQNPWLSQQQPLEEPTPSHAPSTAHHIAEPSGCVGARLGRPPNGKVRVEVLPKGDSNNDAVLRDFALAAVAVETTAT